MAFSVGNRVKVNDDSSQQRRQLGTVISVDGNDHQVRLDGNKELETHLFTTGQLQTTTLACPITY